MNRDQMRIISNLIEYAEQRTCKHEETYRGGANWTICRECNQQWADDEGGFQPYVEPVEIAEAKALLTPSSLPCDLSELYGELVGIYKTPENLYTVEQKARILALRAECISLHFHEIALNKDPHKGSPTLPLNAGDKTSEWAKLEHESILEWANGLFAKPTINHD